MKCLTASHRGAGQSRKGPGWRRASRFVVAAAVLVLGGFAATAQEFELGDFSLSYGATAASDPEFTLDAMFTPSPMAELSDGEFELAGSFTGTIVPPTSGLAPLLNIQTAPGGVRISWPALPEFILERTAQLSSPDWTPVGQPPVQSGDEYSVTLPVTPSPQFFRLRRSGSG